VNDHDVIDHSINGAKEMHRISEIEQLVNMLTGEEHVMHTCSLVHVQLRINSWTEINYKTKGRLLRMWKPRDLI
jgi:hypothetical protein